MSDRDLQRRAEAIFMDLIELPADRWPGEVAARCGGDRALESEVNSLLSVHRYGGDFLSNPELLARSILAGLPAIPDEDHLPPGTAIGDYTIRSFLGAGGMGSVYIAEQQRPRRTVALKVIRHASRAMLRRFEHEAEILGRLQHPGIAQIFEAGAAPLSTSGQHIPFIAMEFIEGSTITEHARARNLSTQARLDLLARVCDAVHHAHQRAVIHRDLKPANILIDRAGEPKVLDFGVARVLDIQFTTARTNMGQLVGTLPYMSPEQVSGDTRDVDTRSDVYALGVILYQLLADRLPVDVSGRSIPDAIHLIRDQPHESLSRVSRVFRGEIDTIVSRALEKDKDRRYQSAAALAEDLRRYLRSEPILAKQDSAMYLLRKAIRRYRAAVAGISLAVIGLVAFSLYAWRQSGREAAARLDAQMNAAEADRLRTLADNRAAELSRQLRTNTIERARLLAQNGNLRAAEDILWPLHRAEPTPHSGWALWDMYLRMPCIATLPGHRAEIYSLTASDNGARLATGAEDGQFIIWDADALTPIASVDAHERAIYGLAFLPDGSLLTSAIDGAVRTWTPDGKPLRSIVLPGDGVLNFAAFDLPSGGRHIAAACRDGLIRVIDGDTLGVVRTLHDRRPGQARIAADATGGLIAAGSEDGTLRIWTTASDAPDAEVKLEPGSIASIAISPDGSTLAVGGGPANRWIRTWRTRPGSLTRLAESRWNNGTVRSLQFSRDGSRLLAAGYHRFEILRSDTCQPAPSPIRFSQPTMRAAWLPARGRIAATDGPNVRLWLDSEERIVRRIPAHAGGATAVLAIPAGLCSAGADGVIRVWEFSADGSLTEAFRLEGHRGRIRSLHTDRGGQRLVSVGSDPEDGAVLVWDLPARRLAQRITIPRRAAFCARIAPDASWLAVTARDRTIRVFELPGGGLVHELDSGERDSGNLTLSHDASFITSVHSGGRAVAWDTATWQRLSETQLPDGTWSVTPILDSGAVAIGGWTGTITRWDPRTGRTLAVPTSHAQMVTDAWCQALAAPAVERSAPTAILLSAGSDGSVCISDPIAGLALATVQLGSDSVNGVTLSPDGSFIVAACSDGTLAVVDVREAARYVAGNRRGAGREGVPR